ncbi:MAG: hypothetical protein KGP28_07365 [Bdellovibrionales bacterium]|nr:hypothetical protein [Bdellovibrionales bacterium]
MKRLTWIILSLLLFSRGMASLPESPRNGVVRAGLALGRILDETSPESPISKCTRTANGMNLFSDSCKAFLDQLQKKLALMTLESDIQIQSEKLSHPRRQVSHRKKVESLSNLNLVSTQAEDALKLLKSSRPDDQFHSLIREILPELKKVQQAYHTYLELLYHGKKL